MEVEEGEAGLQKCCEQTNQSSCETYESKDHETLGSCDLSVIFYS